MWAQGTVAHNDVVAAQLATKQPHPQGFWLSYGRFHPDLDAWK